MGLLATVIVVASVLPRSAGVGPPLGPGPVGVVGADKWLHALAYAGLAAALLFALAATGRSAVVVVALALLGAMAFGFGVELLQAPLPTRRFDRLDAVANGVGATVATLAWWAARSIRGRPTSRRQP